MATQYNSDPRAKRGPPAGIGWTLIVFGVFFLSVALLKDVRRAAFGQFAEGEIIKITERSSIGGGGTDSRGRRKKSGGVSHILTVRFTPTGGERMEVDTLATWGFSEKVGDKVRLIHLPGKPQDAEIYSVKQVWLPLATGLAVGSLCLGGGVLILRWRKRVLARS